MDDAEAIDDAVGDFRRNQFAAQAVFEDLLAILVLHRLRESVDEDRFERLVLDQLAGFQGILQHQLGRRQKDRDLRAGEAEVVGGAAHIGLAIGETLRLPVEGVHHLQRFHDVPLRFDGLAAADLGDGQGERLRMVVLEDDFRDLFGHVLQQGVAVLFGNPARPARCGEGDLDVHLVVRAIDARGIVDEVGIDPAAFERELDPPGLRDAEIGTFPDDLRTHLIAIDAQCVVRRIADLDIVLVAALDVGADAAEPDEIDRSGEYFGNQHFGLYLAGRDAEHLLRRLAESDGLGRPRIDAAPARDDVLVVILPAGARKFEQALALFPAGRRIGIGVDEDVAMVEGGDELDRLGQQHAVAEDVARHVAAADDGDLVLLHVDPHLAEVPLDGNPGAARGDAHRLMIVAVGTAAGESVVEPEIALLRDRVGHVGEPRRSLVGGDDEIRVVSVEDADIVRVHDLVLDDVVGDGQEGANEDLVRGLAFRGPAFPVAGGVGKLLGIEAALRARRHDDGVLRALRLHQAEHFGAEVVAAVGPSKATARDRSGAQVNTLDPARIDEDFAPRHGLGQVRHERGIDLERKRLVRCRGERIGPQDRADQRLIEAQQPVVIDRMHLDEAGADFVVRCILGVLPRPFEGGVVARLEDLYQCLRDVRRTAQGIDDGVDGEADPGLPKVAIERAQPGRLARGETRFRHQTIERVVLLVIVEDAGDRLFDRIGPVEDGCGVHAFGKREREVVDRAEIALVEPRRHFGAHREAEILERRDGIGQGQAALGLIQLEAQLVARVVLAPEQPGIAMHHPACRVGFDALRRLAMRFRRQRAQSHDVAGCLARAIVGAIGIGETLGKARRDRGGASRLHGLCKFGLDRFAPAAQHGA